MECSYRPFYTYKQLKCGSNFRNGHLSNKILMTFNKNFKKNACKAFEDEYIRIM